MGQVPNQNANKVPEVIVIDGPESPPEPAEQGKSLPPANDAA